MFFKLGYFKPIHTICFDLMRNNEKYSIAEIAYVSFNYVLFSLNIAPNSGPGGITGQLSSSVNVLEDKNTSTNNGNGAIKNIVFGGFPGFGGGGGLGGLSNLFNMPTISPPYLPPIDSNKYKFTLVLDLDETLIHFFYTPSAGTFLIRPYCFELLKTLSKIYEIVIFTAAMKDVSLN